ncbi:HD domain-containing protein [archaeon]|nr:HD domain-containing protein [archaeon]
MNKEQITKKTEEFMIHNIPNSRISKDNNNTYYLKHIKGARKYAKKLAKTYNVDKFIVDMAAILHDIAADVGENHAEKSAKIANIFLTNINLEKTTKEKIINCIKSHSMGAKTDTIEQQILQDADGLIFIEDTYKFYFEVKQQKNTNSKAKKLTEEKITGMLNKIKTEEGIKLSKKLIDKSSTNIKHNIQ